MSRGDWAALAALAFILAMILQGVVGCAPRYAGLPDALRDGYGRPVCLSPEAEC